MSENEVVRTEWPEGPAQGRREGAADALVLCEHASNAFPQRFGTLGLGDAARQSHAAWDPGALELARALADHLHAPLVAAGVSRLLYDCNRPPEAPGAMPAQSEVFEIPGNRDLDARARAARVREIYQPFLDEVARTQRATRPRALVTMHTFTPVYNGARRAVEIGVLHDADSRLADAMLARAASDPAFDTRRNQPYGPEDGVTHSLKIHGVERGIANVMIEVRNDLVATDAGLERVSAWLNPLVAGALADVLAGQDGAAS